MKLQLKLLFVVLIFSFQSCVSEYDYVCECVDVAGNITIERGKYKGNDPERHLIAAEGLIPANGGYESCDCYYE